MNEDSLQKSCVRWFKLAYPNKLIIHVPNGGRRNKIEAAKFKKMGVLPGVPDILIFEPQGRFAGLAIELKYEKNKSTNTQIEVQEKLSQRNWFVCKDINSIDGFMDAVCYYFSLGLNISA